MKVLLSGLYRFLSLPYYWDVKKYKWVLYAVTCFVFFFLVDLKSQVLYILLLFPRTFLALEAI